jgi:hypothetical protein
MADSPWRLHFDDTQVQATEIPSQYCDHPLVAGRAFFTLPKALLDGLQKHLGEDAFDPELLTMEHILSNLCGDHVQTVGFWRRGPVLYYHLRRNRVDDLPIDQARLTELGWDWSLEEVNQMLTIGERRSKWLDHIVKGYAGWLMTHPVFLDEHDRLMKEYRESADEWGLPYLPMATTGPVPSEMHVTPTPDLTEFCHALTAFYLRWRLSGLAAPNLPVPLQPMTPVSAPILAMGPMNQVGALFFLPDTFPTPSQDVLRAILDDPLRVSAPAHLAGWTALVARDNPAKNQIARFGRLFELQHYRRVLQARHPGALHRRKERLELALAGFLGVNEATVHSDLLFIGRRLGPDWIYRDNNRHDTIQPPTSPRSAARRTPR